MYNIEDMTNFNKTITQIRNILRSVGITGMESINHCITFIIMKYMTKTTCENLHIPEKYSYNNLIDMVNSDSVNNDDIYKLVYDKKNPCILRFIHQVFGFTNIKFKLESIDNLIKIIKLIDTLDLQKLEIDKDIIGTIYELHLKTGSTGGGMRDLGQYFTHRSVIEYMIKLCNPKKIGDKIEKIIDPTCGTGGFLTMTVKYINEKYPDIDWEKNKDRLIGFDLDENVVNITKINLLIEAKTFMDKVICRDTLYKDMKITEEQGNLMADILLCNEPMGITNLQHANCCDRIKDLKIRGTKAEPLFLQLFMEALNKNGRCAVVVPDGVLFNESNLHQGTRKKLIEEFNLAKVITLNDKEFFINTGVQTSILYFENNGKTEKTRFSSISLNGDELVEDIIMDVDYDTLVKNNYSLFINKYKVTLENRIDGIEYKKLGDICEFLPKSKRPASFGKDTGKFEFFTSSMKIKRCDIADYNQKSLIIGDGGVANINYSSNFSCSDHNYVLICNDKNINIKYIYFYLRFNISIIELGFKGSTLKNLSKNFVKDLEIPIPSLEVQNAIVKQLDIINENNATCQKQIDEFKKIMKYYVETNTLFGEEKRLEDICKFQNGKTITKKDLIDGEYPVVGGGQTPMGKHNKYNTEENTILCSSSGAYSGFISMYNTKVWKSDCFSIIGNNINNMYLYNILKYYQEKIYLLQVGSGQPHVYSRNLKELKIKVVSPDEQQKIVDYCDNQQMMVDKLEENIENNNILMKTILENKLKQQSGTSEKPVISSEESLVSDEELTSQHAIAESTIPVDLSKLNKKELMKMCKDKKLNKYSKLKKSELIDLLK
jgi:type I restriction enzyme, S subunit